MIKKGTQHEHRRSTRIKLSTTLGLAASILLLSACAQHSATLSDADTNLDSQGQLDDAALDSNITIAQETEDNFTSISDAREHAASHASEDSIDDPSSDDSSLDQVDPDSSADAAALDALATNSDSTSSEVAIVQDDIWQRIRSGYALPDADHPGVIADRNWYARNQAYIDRTFDRARPYLHHIVEEVEKRGMPMEIVLLPVVESAFQPFAYSHGRAAGIWQFIPGTARRFGLKIDWWYDGRRDIYAATTAALDYLEILHKHFDGDWLLALAAYNTGEGNVARSVRKNKRAGKGIEFWDLKLPRETRGYVPKLLGIASIIAEPAKYGITLPAIANQATIGEVDLGSQLDLAIAADMADLSLDELYILNPGYNRWATSPDGPHHLLLPLDKIDNFKTQLAALPKSDRVRWVRHKIREGENLGTIAEKYKTTVSTLQRVNKIRGNMIRAGKHLLIPTASRAKSSYALSADQRLASKQAKPKGDNKIIHIVENGDTLWDLAMAHKVGVRKLAAWNGIAPTDPLRLGQKLVIWTKNSSQHASASFPASNPLGKSATQKINYRVRNGDSLARISQRFNVSVKELRNWNPSARGKYLQPGQRLTVYVDVTQLSENI